MSGPVLHAVRHLPGPAWVTGVDPREQPGARDHALHYRQLLQEGKLLLGGPFLDAEGGLVIAAPQVSREELAAFAAADPAVASGLIRFEIWSWYAVMRSPDLPQP